MVDGRDVLDFFVVVVKNVVFKNVEVSDLFFVI